MFLLPAAFFATVDLIAGDQGGLQGGAKAIVCFAGAFLMIAVAILVFCSNDWVLRHLIRERVRKADTTIASLPSALATLEFQFRPKQGIHSHSQIEQLDGAESAMVFFDRDNSRLLIEGMETRYQILSRDVTELRELNDKSRKGFAVTFRIEKNLELTLLLYSFSALDVISRIEWKLLPLRLLSRNLLIEQAEHALLVSRTAQMEWSEPVETSIR